MRDTQLLVVSTYLSIYLSIYPSIYLSITIYLASTLLVALRWEAGGPARRMAPAMYAPTTWPNCMLGLGG